MDKRWRAKQVKLVERAQDRCVSRAVDRTEAVLYQAVDYIWAGWEKTGHYLRPSLNELFNVSSDFYRQVIEEAFAHAEAVKLQDKRPLKPRKLANRKGPKRLPNTLRDLVQVFGDRRYWPAIMKESDRKTERLRRVYLRKLEKRFRKLLPEVSGGVISPEAAKKQLKEEWQTTKARVTTIFRTETTNYFSKTQVAFFNKDPEIIGFMFDSVRDRARTDICRSRHGMVLKPGTKLLKDNQPALHYNCRSHLIPLADTPENRKIMEAAGNQPENRKLAPLDPKWR